jgi:uncharacterized protein
VNLSSKVVHRPKIHLIDTGLAAARCGLTVERLLNTPELFGALLETFVVMELRKQLSWSSTHPSLWHFRDRGGAEVDVVIEYPDGRIVAIEVKSGATPSHTSMLAGCGSFAIVSVTASITATWRPPHPKPTAPEAHPLEDRLSAIPVTALWSH